MYNIYYLNFNSKYNNQVKRYDTMEYYEDFIVGEQKKENLKWNDEINTTITANIDTIPNYCVVCDENDTIVSRWFVIDSKYLRLDQYELILERDVMADNYYDILDMPLFMRKATITDPYDPAIYQRDGTFNQIKKKEIPLMDETQAPWVVGYISKDFTEATVRSSYPVITDPTFEVNNISSWEHYNKTYTTNIGISTHFTLYTAPVNASMFSRTEKATYVFTDYLLRKDSEERVLEAGDGYLYSYTSSPDVGDLLRNIRGTSEYQNLIEDYAESLYPVIDISVLANLNGRMIKDTATNICYRIKVIFNEGGDYSKITPSQEILDYLNTNIAQPQSPESSLTGSPTNETWKLAIKTLDSKVELEQIFESISVSITTDRNHLEDAPYDMFCIPYSALQVRYGTFEEKFTTQKEAAIAIATSIATQLGENCYDIQLLPYFPCREILKETDSSLMATRTKFQIIKDNNDNPVSILLWARRANFDFLLNRTTYKILPQTNAINKKVKYETELYRLCSPNYAAAFDFNPHVNDGVPYYEASCSYRPFQPYIHINPHFNEDGLYGGNYNDARGLVCSGDFSLAQVSDAWVNYEINNKNYQQIFNRQIQTLELQQKVGRIQDTVGMFTGTAQGAVSGALGGSMVGGPKGAAIGGVIGGVSSLAGGITDVAINEQLRRDQLSAAHTYQKLNLANIKAMPDTLTKITAYNQQNKIFPFVEVYSATDEEIEYFRTQLQYSGMSINRIAKISDFLSSEVSDQFIQGSIIRVPYTMDAHLAAIIAQKLENGIYLE